MKAVPYLVPEPTATTVASIPFFWPFSGIRIPPLDFVSAAIRCNIGKLIFLATKTNIHSNQCCGSRMFILDPRSEFFPSRIPDPHQRIKYFSPKNGFQTFGNMIRVVYPGSGYRIRIFYPSRIQGSKRHRIPDPDTQQWFKLNNMDLRWQRKRDFITDGLLPNLIYFYSKAIIYINLRHNKVPLPKDICAAQVCTLFSSTVNPWESYGSRVY